MLVGERWAGTFGGWSNFSTLSVQLPALCTAVLEPVPLSGIDGPEANPRLNISFSAATTTGQPGNSGDSTIGECCGSGK